MLNLCRIPTHNEICRALAHQKELSDFFGCTTPESKAYWKKYYRELRAWMNAPSALFEENSWNAPKEQPKTRKRNGAKAKKSRKAPKRAF